MSTSTPKLGLVKQDAGENPGTWHVALNSNADKLDTFIGGVVNGNPNTIGTAATFVGQRVFQPNVVAWWVATSAGAPGIWAREIPRGIQVPYSGLVATIPAGWKLCDGSSVNIDGELILTPDLRGRFIVGHNPADPTFDARPDSITANKAGGEKSVQLLSGHMPGVTLFTSNDAPQVKVTLATEGRGNGQQTTLVPAGEPGSTPLDVLAPTHTHNVTLNPGVQTNVPILPPYFAEAIIMKL